MMISSSNNLSNESQKPAAGIQKISRAACINCHDRKVRCDAHKRGFPCSNCINSRRANCRIHEKKKRPLARSSNNFVPIRRRSNTGSNPPPAASTIQNAAKPPDSFESASTIAPGSSTSAIEGNSSKRNLVEFVDAKDIPNRSLQRGVRITYVGKDVSNINFLVRQRDDEGNETAHHFASDEIVRQYLTNEPESIPREAFILPDQALADELVQAYFTHVNPGCPIVEEETFMGQYRGRNPADPPSLLVLHAILLVGAHVSRDRPDRDSLKATFFRRAKMLFDARLERSRDVVVQAALLLTWHSDGPEDIAANAWYWVGIAARTATGLGMHRDAGKSKLIQHDMMIRTWRRIWWILVQFDVTVSLSYGRPQAINLDECDVQTLSDSDFEGCGPNVQIDYVKQLTELCLLISKVLRDRFGLRVSHEDRKAALGNADQALANWCLMLPEALQMRSSEMRLWSSSLHLIYNNFLILLHRPHPRAQRGSDDYGPNDSDICSAAAIAVTTIFEDLRSKDRIRYLWISDINALFTAMVQISVELRFSNPVLAINALRRFDSTLLSLRELAEYWINAESILRLFEESSHIQHGIRLGKGVQAQNDSAGSGNMSEEIATIQHDTPTQQMESSWRPDAQSDLDMLAAAARAASNPTAPIRQNMQDDSNGWKDLFPQSNMSPDDFMMSSDFMPMDSEWREIYWQEPGISGSFGDAIWGWP